MDHLPLPQNHFLDYPKIKLLCPITDASNGRKYGPNESEFQSLKDQFFDTTRWSSVPPLAIAAPVYQQLLWFGLICNVFTSVGLDFNAADFIADDPVLGHRLSTRSLHKYLWYWAAVEAHASASENVKHARMITGFLDLVAKGLKFYVDYKHTTATSLEDFGPILNDEPSDVLLGIVILAEIIDRAQQLIYGRLSPSSESSRYWLETFSTRSSFLQAGWCVKELAKVKRQLGLGSPSILLFLSRIDRHISEKDHTDCSVNVCDYEQIDYSTYQPVHYSVTCSCCHITPGYSSLKRMDQAICKGDIPILTFSWDGAFSHQPELQIQSTNETRGPFVAISHVWSDRLGNLHENALPACQLNRLQQQVNALYPDRLTDIPFWMDTICVPRDGATRRMAIVKMKDVYSRADKVLVIDSSLYTVSSSISPAELYCRITFAPWSTRVWTYHEGALAQEIYFQLADRAVNGDDIRRQYNTDFFEDTGTVLIKDITTDQSNERARTALYRSMSLNEQQDDFVDLNREAASLRPGEFLAKSAIEERASSYKPQGKISNDCDDDTDAAPGGGLTCNDADTTTTSLEITKQEAKGESEHSKRNSQLAGPEQDHSASESQIQLTAQVEEERVPTMSREGSTALKEREKALQEEIKWLKVQIQAVKEEDKRQREELLRVKANFENLYRNSIGGFKHVQQPPPEFDIETPQYWLDGPVNSGDRNLSHNIRRLSRNARCRFWLRGFDIIMEAGQMAYYNLRTSFKRQRLRMNTATVPQAPQIGEVVSALRWRHTSWAGDEAICFAIILGMDVQKIQQVQHEDRMRMLASCWHEVPRGLAFCDLPRLQDSDYGWMPQSFLGSGLTAGKIEPIEGRDREVAHRTDRGLCLRSSGVSFDSGALGSSNRSLAFSVADVHYKAYIPEASVGRGSWCDIDNEPFAVLFEGELMIRSTQRHAFGLVVAVLDASTDTFYVLHRFCVRIKRLEGDHGVRPVPSVKVFGDDQHWCVG